jgi:hypothetical protein
MHPVKRETKDEFISRKHREYARDTLCENDTKKQMNILNAWRTFTLSNVTFK